MPANLSERLQFAPQQYDIRIPKRSLQSVEVISQDFDTDPLVDFLNDPSKQKGHIVSAMGRNVWVPAESVGISPLPTHGYVEFSGGFWLPFDKRGQRNGLRKISGRVIQPPNDTNFAHSNSNMTGRQYYEGGTLVVVSSKYQPTGGYTKAGVRDKIQNTSLLNSSLSDCEQMPFALPIPLIRYEYQRNKFGVAWLTQHPNDRMERRVIEEFANQNLKQMVSNIVTAATILHNLHERGFMHGQCTLGNIGRSFLSPGRSFPCLYDLSTLRALGTGVDAKLNRIIDIHKFLASSEILFDHIGAKHSMPDLWTLPFLSTYLHMPVQETTQKYGSFATEFSDQTDILDTIHALLPQL